MAGATDLFQQTSKLQSPFDFPVYTNYLKPIAITYYMAPGKIFPMTLSITNSISKQRSESVTESSERQRQLPKTIIPCNVILLHF